VCFSAVAYHKTLVSVIGGDKYDPQCSSFGGSMRRCFNYDTNEYTSVPMRVNGEAGK
jgi:hypothetical protein